MELITDQDIIAGYLCDASNIKGHAEALVRPASVEEVSNLLALCQRRAIPITVTAQRTSTTGGPVPNGGWLLSTEKLNRIHALDEVDAGVLLGDYQTRIEGDGFLFPPDPTSRNECTIGAAVACNASGARSFRYGPTRRWIKALEVVFPDGEVRRIDRNTPIPSDWPEIHWDEPKVKTAAGFYPATNLMDLMIGQEGSLGVITRIWTHIIPAPSEVMGMIVFFPTLSNCLDCVERVRAGAARPHQEPAVDALNPRAIEFFDHHAIELIRQRVDDIPPTAHCGLFMEIEHDGDPDLERWFTVFESVDALVDDIIAADDEESRQRLYAVRHAIPAGVNEIVVRNGMPKVGTDFAVPDDALEKVMEMYSAVTMKHVLFGHIGDNHLHLNLLPESEAELAAAKRLYRDLALSAVDMGGTVSAEHGIGRIKRQLLADMVGESVITRFQQLKHRLDPAWILGRDILFSVGTVSS